MSMDPHIRLAGKQDMEAVLDLLNGVFSRQQRSSYRRDEKYWHWKYLENPFGSSWLSVAEVGNSIVAVDNLWPWELSYGGQVYKAVQACDSAVHPDYRGQGIFRSLRKWGLENARAQNIDLVFNYPNTQSLSLNLSLGWHYLGKIGWWVKILKPAELITGQGSAQQSKSFTMDEAYSLDIRLIQELVSDSPAEKNLLRINRKPGFHSWRYEKHPSRSYGMVHVENRGRSTIAIFTINQKGKTREMLVVDLLGSPENSPEVIRKAVEAGRKMGVGFVALMRNPEFAGRSLWRAGFVPRKLKNMVVLALNKELQETVKHASNWSLMAGMHDSI